MRDGLPASYCTDVSELISRLQEIHGRDVKHINMSVDSGKGL